MPMAIGHFANPIALLIHGKAAAQWDNNHPYDPIPSRQKTVYDV
jgi:hypothetical protein